MTMRPRRSLPTLLLLVLVAACGTGEPDPDGRDASEASPRNAYADAGYSSGLESAPVTVVEFSDFGCPYCAQFARMTYPDLHTEFVLSGQVRWVFVPFVSGQFPNSRLATLTAECAAEQDRFWPMHDIIYDRQAEWRRERVEDDYFTDLAREIALDVERFQQCFDDMEPADRITHHNDLARLAGIRGTPSFIINDRLVQGALPPDHFRTLMEWAVMAAEGS